MKRGRDWFRTSKGPQTDLELLALRRCVERGTPYGKERWQSRTVSTLGLASTLRRGRPRKCNKEA